MKYFYLFLLTGIVSCSNKSAKRDPLIVMADYSAIHTEFTHYRPIQEKFIEKSADAIYQVKADNTAAIDTKELHALLDSAKIANKAFIAKLDFNADPDSTINYRAAVVVYTKLLDSLYANEFPAFLQILETNDTGRLQKITTLVPRFQALKTAGVACDEGGQALKTKYNFQVTDTLATEVGK